MIGLLAAGVLLVGLFAAALPRLVDRHEFQLELRERAAATLGTPIEWQGLEVGLWPPRLTIRKLVFGVASGSPEDARLTAESAELRLALLPILERRVQIDSLIVSGVELVVTRTSKGFLLPVLREEEQDVEAMHPDDPGTVEATAGREAFEFALRRIVLSESRILLHDRTRPSLIEWRLEGLEFEALPAQGRSGMFLFGSRETDALIRFDARFELADGGRLDIEGTSTRQGVLDVRVVIESFDLAIANPFVFDLKLELGGLAVGKARVVGAAASPEFISLDVEVTSGLLRMPDYFAEGPFRATLKLESPFSDRPSGRIDLDLTAARLEVGDQFEKPAGKHAQMTIEFESDESGEIVFESRLEFRDIHEILSRDALGDSTLGPRVGDDR